MTPSNDCGNAAEVCITVGIVAPPELVVTNPATACAPESVDLLSAGISNDSGGIGQVSFYASFSEAQNGSPELPSTLVTTSGTYWVRMDTGTDCFDVASIQVTIEKPDLVTADPQSVCNPTTIDLDTDVTKSETNGWAGGTYSYFADTMDAVANQNVLANSVVSTSGTYWVRYTTPNGCFDVAGVDVSIEPSPDISAGNTLSICGGQSVDLLDANITDDNNTNISSTLYYDQENDAVIGSANNALSSTLVNSTGVYFARYETTSGCWDTAHIQVLGAVSPMAVISGGGTLCTGGDGTITFTITGGTGTYDLVYTDGMTNYNLNGINSPNNENGDYNVECNL